MATPVEIKAADYRYFERLLKLEGVKDVTAVTQENSLEACQKLMQLPPKQAARLSIKSRFVLALCFFFIPGLLYLFYRACRNAYYTGKFTQPLQEPTVIFQNRLSKEVTFCRTLASGTEEANSEEAQEEQWVIMQRSLSGERSQRDAGTQIDADAFPAPQFQLSTLTTVSDISSVSDDGSESEEGESSNSSEQLSALESLASEMGFNLAGLPDELLPQQSELVFNYLTILNSRPTFEEFRSFQGFLVGEQGKETVDFIKLSICYYDLKKMLSVMEEARIAQTSCQFDGIDLVRIIKNVQGQVLWKNAFSELQRVHNMTRTTAVPSPGSSLPEQAVSLASRP